MKKIVLIAAAVFSCGVVFASPKVKAKAEKADRKIEEKSKMKTDIDSELFKTDAEFMQTFRSFSDEEVPAYVNGKDGNSVKVAEKERNLAVLAALLGVQGKQEFVAALDKADGENSRLRAGNQKQIEYFGERLRESWLKGDENGRIVSYWLADNCFGDYYTRGGLTDRQRELITFCFLASQGGCEPQLGSHAKANIGLGNTKEYLIAVVTQILPYIGYPRSLNAIRIVNEAE